MKTSSYRAVPQPQHDNEVTFVELSMEKNLLRNGGLRRCRMEVARQVTVEGDDVVELSNEYVSVKRSQRAMIDESIAHARERRCIWIHGRSEVERTQGRRNRVNVDVYASRTGAYLE